MKVSLDINVFLDVFLHRGNFSAQVSILGLMKEGRIQVSVASHVIPTIYYVLRSQLSEKDSLRCVDEILQDASIIPVGIEILRAARTLPFRDFEDAIVEAAAEAAHSDCIITSNTRDFIGSTRLVQNPFDFMISWTKSGS